VKSGLIKLLTTALLIVSLWSVSSAQTSGGASPLPTPSGRLSVNNDRLTGWMTIYLRDQNETPVSAIPQITLTCETDDTVIPEFPRRDGKDWILSGLPIGNTYDVDVNVGGYQPVHETVDIPDIAYGTANVVVTLRPVDQQLAFRPPAGQFVLAPRVQKEIQQGLRDLGANKIASAQKHFGKAIQLAPGNPYVNYITGMSYLLAKQEPKAQPYLEESVSLDPNQVASLLALGTVRFDQANYAGAIDVLSKAVTLDPASWKAQWILAVAYLRERDFLQARDHAEKALAAGKADADPVKLVLVESAARMGDRAGAVATLNSFLSDHPSDPIALKMRAWLAGLPKASPTVEQVAAKEPVIRAAAVSQQPQPIAAPIPLAVAADLPPKPDWAPPDIDREKPFLVSGASCSLPKVLKAAGKNAVRLVTDLERFSSTEEYQTVEIKRDASLETPVSRTFSYMVFIEHPSAGIIRVDEFRDQGVKTTEMPGELADRGAPGLVLVFHPLLQGDFSWSCEGLGEWRSNPVWVVRFEQRSDRPNRLLDFESPLGGYPLPLKGRAWVAENGGQVLHMETDLVTPIGEIKLTREHFVIDYAPVAFTKHKVTLWLPEDVNVYFEYRNRYLHHYHHFRDFQLFWTGATQKVGQPKEAANKSGAKDNPN
jgi:Flp pilus assembly protein TadD